MNFWTLFSFEAKKLFRRRLVWACLAAMVAMSLVTGFLSNRASTHSFNGIEISGEAYGRLTREAENALSGRVIDDALLREVQAAKGIVDEMKLTTYADVETMLGYQGHMSILRWVRKLFEEVPEDLSAEQLYGYRTAFQEEWWDEAALSEGEQAWWRQQERQVETPFVYERTSTWNNVSGIVYSLNIMGILALAVCLPGIFSDEHTRRTDQLNLSAPLGKKLYGAKLLLGILFGFGSFLLYWICGVIPAILVQGADGFRGVIQLLIPDYAMALTAGEVVLILSGLLLISAVVCSVFAMVMAEVLRGGLAATALVTALVFLVDLIPIPYSVRWLEEIVSYLPSQMVTLWEAFDTRLFPWFGTYLTPWQAAPILWTAEAVLLVLLGNRLYSRYQISGR